MGDLIDVRIDALGTLQEDAPGLVDPDFITELYALRAVIDFFGAEIAKHDLNGDDDRLEYTSWNLHLIMWQAREGFRERLVAREEDVALRETRSALYMLFEDTAPYDDEDEVAWHEPTPPSLDRVVAARPDHGDDEVVDDGGDVIRDGGGEGGAGLDDITNNPDFIPPIVDVETFADHMDILPPYRIAVFEAASLHDGAYKSYCTLFSILTTLALQYHN